MTKARADGVVGADAVIDLAVPGTPVVSDLLDQAIQRIFTAGLLLSRAAKRSTPAVATSIEQAINDLDDALRDIRANAVTTSAMDPRSTMLARHVRSADPVRTIDPS